MNTMKVKLAYGDDGIEVDVPDSRTTVLVPSHLPHAADGFAAVVEALRRPVAGQPLERLVRRGERIAISVCDGTRPQPRKTVLSAILREIERKVGIEDVVVIVATGTHRGNTDEELYAMLGDEVVQSVRVVNHDCRDKGSLSWVGVVGDGVPVWLNREWLEADFRITTGFVEPHLFAGFSGGPKMVAPGLAALETVLVLHDARRIGHPNARWGVTRGNPIHEDVAAITAATGVDFSLDVVLDGEQHIVRAFGGEIFSMHRAACAVAGQMAMCPVSTAFDVVLTSNAGFPLDQNLYQSVKGMSAAAQVVKPGGTIVCVAECRDGFPDGAYHQELMLGLSPRELIDSIAARSTTVPDQWQIQIQAQLQTFARVVMHTSFLSAGDLAPAHLEHTDDVGATIEEALGAAGPVARLGVLPYGPLTVPYLL